MSFKDSAARYDAWYRTPLGSLAHALESEAILALAEVKPGKRVVDIGCGTGTYTVELAQRGARVVGIDSSIEMIFIAQEKLREAGLTGHFICGSAEALPFRSGKFDLALAVTSLCFVPLPGHVVSEIHRVLQPRSHLVLGELNRFSLWALLRRLRGLFADSIYNRAHFWGKEEIKQLLQQNGFRLQTVQTLLYFPPINLQVVLPELPWVGKFCMIGFQRRKTDARYRPLQTGVGVAGAVVRGPSRAESF